MIYSSKRFIQIIDPITGELLNKSLILTGRLILTFKYENSTSKFNLKRKNFEYNILALLSYLKDTIVDKESKSYCLNCRSNTEYKYELKPGSIKSGEYKMTCSKCSYFYYLLIDTYCIGNNIKKEKEVL